jgi:hypothetical protein
MCDLTFNGMDDDQFAAWVREKIAPTNNVDDAYNAIATMPEWWDMLEHHRNIVDEIVCERFGPFE